MVTGIGIIQWTCRPPTFMEFLHKQGNACFEEKIPCDEGCFHTRQIRYEMLATSSASFWTVDVVGLAKRTGLLLHQMIEVDQSSPLVGNGRTVEESTQIVGIVHSSAPLL